MGFNCNVCLFLSAKKVSNWARMVLVVICIYVRVLFICDLYLCVFVSASTKGLQ